MTQDNIDIAVKELMHKIYGPKFCKHCDKERPVIVYELEGTRDHKMEGTVFTVSFDGSKVCSVCMKPIDDTTVEEK